MSTHLYYIIQEAVRNIIRHSSADSAAIIIKSSDDKISVTISDNGLGISSDKSGTGGMGIKIMKYRAKMIGAALDIKSSVNGGTEVALSLRVDS